MVPRALRMATFLGFWLLSWPVASQVRPVAKAGTLVVADQYFREGVFDKALIEYQKAFEQNADPALYYNIAQCLHRMEHFQKAILYYELFISKNLSSALIPHVQRHIEDCEKKWKQTRSQQEGLQRPVPGVRKIAVVSEPPGAEVYVDAFSGTPVGVTPLMLELDTTEHLIVLKKTDFREVSQLVNSGVQGMSLLRFDLEPVNAPRVVPDMSPRLTERAVPTLPPRLVDQWWFWSGLAMTSVFVSSSIVTGLKTLDLQNEYETTQDVGIKNRGERYRTWTDVLITGALVSGIATGVGIMLFQARPQNVSKTDALTVLPTCSHLGCGLTFSFSY